MATKISEINWEEAIEQAGDKTRKTSGMVGIIDKALKTIMKDGREFTVSQLTHILETGFNSTLEEGDEEIKVNWSTVKHTLNTHDGFKAVEDKDNTFVLDSGVVKAHGRRNKAKKTLKL